MSFRRHERLIFLDVFAKSVTKIFEESDVFLFFSAMMAKNNTPVLFVCCLALAFLPNTTSNTLAPFLLSLSLPSPPSSSTLTTLSFSSLFLKQNIEI
jgi:hypothetical protein